MFNTKAKSNIGNWVYELLTQGKNTFSVREIRKAFPGLSEIAVKRALNRLSAKNRIVSVHKGFYVIVSYEYAAKGIVPPLLYVDNLMRFLKRPYYVSLLSAASLYGAAHQAPQVFFVNTTFPSLRPSLKKGTKIKYLSIKEAPQHLLTRKKTESGYIQVSSPELTAIDLINFSKHIGGLSRAATVLKELCENIRPENINEELVTFTKIATLQRFGYIVDKILHLDELADTIEGVCKKADLKFYRIPLMTTAKRKGLTCDERWQVIENSLIEID
ncbi:MAG: type IV toxin-antitoxin system AbiEi family antitoxin [Cyclobacteriaceae bacterium]|nr:type IV toxin-antitoxin system AbiEi family antitoxin [Cyclobacteriaceae bacterium]